MIKLLEEENEELIGQVGYLQTLLKDRDRQIQALEEEIKQMKPSESWALIRQLMNERQTKTGSEGGHQHHKLILHLRAAQRPLLHPQIPKQDRKPRPSLLQAYEHRHQHKQKTHPLLLQKSNRRNQQHRYLTRQLLDYDRAGGYWEQYDGDGGDWRVDLTEEQEQIMLNLETLEQEINMECELPHSPETSKVSRRLFTLQKSTGSQPYSVSQLIEKYQNCIQDYKEYAAYLKAHFCEDINFLAQQSLLPTRSEPNWLPNFLKLTARDLSKTLRKRTRQLQQQNYQLKRIMEQLIYNIELTQHPSSSTSPIDIIQSQLLFPFVESA